MAVIEIRAALEHDLPRLRRVYRDASWSNEGDRALIAAHPEFLELSPHGVREGRTRIAVIDGHIVGFATFIDTRDGLELEDLFVDPAFMRRGVGRALVRDIAIRAGQLGQKFLRVDANPHALAFYDKVGFVGREPVPSNPGGAVRMTLSVGGETRESPDVPSWRSVGRVGIEPTTDGS